MMKMLTRLLLLLIVLLQYRLWLGEDSQRSLYSLQQAVAEQRAANLELQRRNARLEIEVLDLKNGLEAVEERAREQLGMIGEDETFYLLVEPPPP